MSELAQMPPKMTANVATKLPRNETQASAAQGGGARSAGSGVCLACARLGAPSVESWVGTEATVELWPVLAEWQAAL